MAPRPLHPRTRVEAGPPPLYYSALGAAQGPVTLHCLASLVAIGGWWSVLFAPVSIMIGNVLDQCRSLDGTPGGTAFNSAALLRAAMVLHGLLASSMLGATCADGFAVGKCAAAVLLWPVCLLLA